MMTLPAEYYAALAQLVPVFFLAAILEDKFSTSGETAFQKLMDHAMFVTTCLTFVFGLAGALWASVDPTALGAMWATPALGSGLTLILVNVMGPTWREAMTVTMPRIARISVTVVTLAIAFSPVMLAAMVNFIFTV